MELPLSNIDSISLDTYNVSMERGHLRYFVAVAEELSFKRAAERLHIAQPPLSVQIRQLETHVGTQLFSREGHKTRLTDAGRVFLEHARATLAQANYAVTSAQQAGKGEISHLSIGYGTAAEFRVFPQITPSFRRRWPNVQITFHQLGTVRQIDSLRRDELDLAFVWAPVSDAEFDVHELTKERFAVCLFEHHPLARASSLLTNQSPIPGTAGPCVRQTWSRRLS